ncbi:MAG: methyltransferase domain-containing protein [Phycisphaeraceae bacterium]
MKPREDRGRFGRKRKPMPGGAPGGAPASPRTGPPSAPPTRDRPAPGTDWSDVAQWYDELVGDAGSEYHQKVVLPGVIRLLTPRPGEAGIDIACGQGVLCRTLHHKHGARMTGVDASADLIRIARERSDEAIHYDVADARDLSRFEPASFHLAACILAIQNIEPIGPVFEQVARLLKPGGRLVVAMMHPSFRGPKFASWGWDVVQQTQYRRVDRYLQPRKEAITMHPGRRPGLHTWTFHRPLQTYVKALAQAGLLIDALEEWPSHKQSDSGPRAGAENAARREIPLFLALRAVQSSRPPGLLTTEDTQGAQKKQGNG